MGDSASSRNPVEELVDEFLSAYRRGEKPSLTELAERNPEHASEIRTLIPALIAMEELAPRTSDSAAHRQPRQLDRYRILGEINRGGMGVVYEAIEESLGRRVALKVLSASLAADPKALKRFRREASAAARLHHTNIVPVFSVGCDNGHHYYAMQFIDGQSFYEIVCELQRVREGGIADEAGDSLVTTTTGSLTPGDSVGSMDDAARNCERKLTRRYTPPFSPGSVAPNSTVNNANQPSESITNGRLQPSDPAYYPRVTQLFLELADALRYAHHEGVLHRDIKPSNLLLDQSGNAWVTDFGLAKSEDGEDLTQTGDLVGTLRYMAPERFQGEADARSDLYSLGLSLYEMLVFRPAFASSDRAELTKQIIEADPPPPRKLNRNVPRDLETIVLKLVDKSPGRRYQTAQALIQDLTNFLADRPILARRTTLTERLLRWRRRNPLAANLTTAVAVLIVTTAAVATWAAVSLRYQRDIARKHALDLERANQSVQRSLSLAYFTEAQARRSSGRRGQQFESLEALKKAAALLPQLKFSTAKRDQRLLELRNEAIACMTLTDVREIKAGGVEHPTRSWIAVDAQLEYYAVGRADGEVLIHRLQNDAVVLRLPPPRRNSAAVNLVFSPDAKLLAVKYGSRHPTELAVWQVHEGVKRWSLQDLPLEEVIAFSRDSKVLAVGRRDGSISFLKSLTGEERSSTTPGPLSHKLCFHPDGRRVAAVRDTKVHLHDVGTGETLAVFDHSRGCFGAHFSPEGAFLATASADSLIYVWSLQNPQEPWAVLRGHDSEVRFAHFNHLGDRLISYGNDGSARIWDPYGGKHLLTLFERPYRWGPEDRRLVMLRGTRVSVCEISDSSVCRVLYEPKWASGKGPWMADVHPEGRLLLTVSSYGVYLWDLATNRKLSRVLGDGESRNAHVACAFLPDGEAFVTSGDTGLYRWPLKWSGDGKLQVGPPQRFGLKGETGVADLSLDGRSLGCIQIGKAFIVDLQDPARVVKARTTHRYRMSIAVSPDGEWFTTGTWHGTGVKVYDAKTGAQICVLCRGVFNARSRFSPDGKRLVTWPLNRSDLRLWEVGTWKPGPQIQVNRTGDVAFSSDGRLMAHTEAQIVVLRDASTLEEIARLVPPDPQPIASLRFSRDTTRLVAACRTHRVQVWDLGKIRRRLAGMGLDWDHPPFPPSEPSDVRPLAVVVDRGRLANAE